MIRVPDTVMLMRKIAECELRIARAKNIAAQQRAKSRDIGPRGDRAMAARLLSSLEESIAWLRGERDKMLRELTRLADEQSEAASPHGASEPSPNARSPGSQTG
jgi:hypothetical protein